MPKKHRPIIGGEIAIDLILAYHFFNNEFFKGKLPKNVPIFWGTKEQLGKESMATCFYTAPAIVVLNELKELPCVAKMTLLHEMTHLQFPMAKHGKQFQKRMKELAQQGAFIDLW